MLKSSGFDRLSSRRPQRGDHLASKIGFEARCQAFSLPFHQPAAGIQLFDSTHAFLVIEL